MARALLLAVMLALAAAPSAEPAGPRTLTSWCSPSGDVCYGVVKRGGEVRLELTTAARYFGRYRLCVKPPGGGAAGLRRRGGPPAVRLLPGLPRGRRDVGKLGPAAALPERPAGPVPRHVEPRLAAARADPPLPAARLTVRAVAQRVSRAEVRVDGEVRGRVGAGLCVLVGVARGDGEEQALRLAGNLARLRVFPDEDGRFDRSLLDTGGAALVVSQFTLLGDTAKGNRPSFTEAAMPEEAERLYERVVAELRALGVPVETGVFGASMELELVNDGPVTILLDR